MANLNKALTALIVAILFVSSIAGTIIYYNGVVNDRNTTITSLNNQIANLKNETSDLNNETSSLKDEIANLTQYEAKIVSFSSDNPVSIVFAVTEYDFNMAIENTGNVAIQNITLTANLTLSDGESSGQVQTNLTLGIGETQNVRGGVLFNNVLANLTYLSQTWSVELTTPKGILAQQTFNIKSNFS